MAGRNITDANVKNPNLALLKVASQSSVINGLGPKLAVDGDTGQEPHVCSKTTTWETWPWFMVDLGTEYTIKSVAIIVRTDNVRFRNFRIEVSTEDPVTLNGFPAPTNASVCWENLEISLSAAYLSNVLACERAVTGRFIRIMVFNDPRKSIQLVLCEVEVYSSVQYGYTVPQRSENNLAYKKATRQSTTFSPVYSSDKAVDGNLGGMIKNHPCSHTSEVPQPPWWYVDLGTSYVIHSVRIVNRVDCCQFRLKNFSIRVSTKNPTTSPEFPKKIDALICHNQIDIITAIAPVTMACVSPVTGRYIMVFKHDVNPLTLCEVEVFGKPPPINLFETEAEENEEAHQWHLNYVTENALHKQPMTFSATMLAAKCAETYRREIIEVKKYPFIQIDLSTGECRFLKNVAEETLGNATSTWILYKYFS